MAFIESLNGAKIRRARPLLKTITSRLSLWRSRRELAKLDARQLEDIGVSPEAALAEANRSLWDVPHTWHDR